MALIFVEITKNVNLVMIFHEDPYNYFVVKGYVPSANNDFFCYYEILIEREQGR